MLPILSILDIGMKVLDKFVQNPDDKAKAQLELTKMVNDGEFNMYKTEQDNVSTRWTADMGSDSWLSKNVRPLSLVVVFGAYFVFATGSAFGFNVNQSYVELLGQWGMLIMSAYFGGRTLEKIMEIKGKK